MVSVDSSLLYLIRAIVVIRLIVAQALAPSDSPLAPEAKYSLTLFLVPLGLLGGIEMIIEVVLVVLILEK
jgi:hypothetical protein